MTAKTPTIDAHLLGQDDGRDPEDSFQAAMNRKVDTVRSTSERVGAHVPEAVGSVRDGAIEAAITVRSWPDPTRQLAAGIAFGLALGFTLAGAPRLFAAFALVPAIVASAPGFDRR